MSSSREFSWSDTQQSIIDSRNENLLVSAGAGAGKTAVLVEKIVRRIMEENDSMNIDQLLVVTFTEKAALEMKERITKALTRALVDDPGNKRIKAQLQLINKANISTLHSFCNTLLRKYFYTLDLDPDFGICGEYEVELIKDEVLEKYLEEMYEHEDDQYFFGLVDFYGGSMDDTNLKKLILGLHAFSKSHPDPIKWLFEAGKYFEMEDVQGVDDLKGTNFFEFLKSILGRSINYALRMLEIAIDKAYLPGGPSKYIDRLEEELETGKTLMEGFDGFRSWNDLRQMWSGFEFKRLPSIKKNDPVDEDLKEEVKNYRKAAKDEIMGIKERYFARDDTDIVAELKEVYPYMKHLTDMVIEFDRRYLEVKKERKLLDYSDLEHKALELLQFEEIVSQLKNQYKEVMVDEYQDINGVQNEILETICDSYINTSPYMFMVGDVKQSIYRFRLAEPGLFLEKYNHYRGLEEINSQEETPGKLVELRENFRSAEKVIEGVNFIFHKIMNKEMCGIDYDERTKLKAKKNFPPIKDTEEYLDDSLDISRILIEKPIEVFFCEKGEEGFLTDEEKEGKLIARKIRELVEGGYCVYDDDSDEYRPVQYRDIVVLNRQLQSHGERITEIFTEEGIPFYAELNKGYFKAPEVQTMLSLLKVIDNPRQDIPLAAVLRSPLFNLTEKELFELRGLDELYDDLLEVINYSGEENSDDIKNYIPEIDQMESDTYDKIARFLEMLSRWRDLSRKDKLSKLIWDIYEETGYLDFVRGLIDGEERKANLYALYDLAIQFDTFSQSGLFRFLRFIEKLEERNEDMAKARVLSEKEDVVRLMSIHKSKGLEFKVVFVMGLGKKFNLNEIKQDILCDKELGLGPKIVDLEKRIKYPTLAHEVIKEKIKQEILAEEMRILYVALTRAEEHLVLVGSGKDIQAHDCQDNINCYLDWIIPRVTADDQGVGETARGKNDGIFDLKVYAEDDLSKADLETGEISVDINSLLDNIVERDSELREKIKNTLDYQYPYKENTYLPAKLTVTQIQQEMKEKQREFIDREEEGEVFLPKPKFTKEQNDKPTGAEIGSAYHLIYQHLPLEEINRLLGEVKKENQIDEFQTGEHELNKEFGDMLQALDKILEDYVKTELISTDQKKMVDPKKIIAFFANDELGKRVLKNRNNLTRELNFTLGISPQELDMHELTREEPENEEDNIVIQGAIDYLVDEKDGFILIDFKTDRIEEDKLEDLAEDYRIQLSYYKMAVERILKKTVKGVYLYHIGHERSMKVEL